MGPPNSNPHSFFSFEAITRESFRSNHKKIFEFSPSPDDKCDFRILVFQSHMGPPGVEPGTP